MGVWVRGDTGVCAPTERRHDWLNDNVRQGNMVRAFVERMMNETK